jgi:hypothetical protein
MTSPWIRWSGLAALLGGAMWAVKGLWVLVTGDQPPLLFELPLVLFPFGLLGLHARLGGEGGRRADAGRGVAAFALAAGTVAVVTGIVDPDLDGVVPGVAIAGSALGTVAGLLLLGGAARRSDRFPPRWRSLPLSMGIATPVLLTVVGGALAAVDERLLEVPLIVLAAAWIGLGALIAGPIRPPGPSVSRPTHRSRSA